MTNQQHPITPPTELVQQWLNADAEKGLFAESLAAKAAQWGADQELEACSEWLESYDYDEVGRQLAEVLRAARRSKPPSLKEQALALLQPGEPRLFNSEMQDTLRRALEQLDD